MPLYSTGRCSSQWDLPLGACAGSVGEQQAAQFEQLVACLLIRAHGSCLLGVACWQHMLLLDAGLCCIEPQLMEDLGLKPFKAKAVADQVQVDPVLTS